jgi:hypothetical protein
MTILTMFILKKKVPIIAAHSYALDNWGYFLLQQNSL